MKATFRLALSSVCCGLVAVLTAASAGSGLASSESSTSRPIPALAGGFSAEIDKEVKGLVQALGNGAAGSRAKTALTRMHKSYIDALVRRLRSSDARVSQEVQEVLTEVRMAAEIAEGLAGLSTGQREKFLAFGKAHPELVRRAFSPRLAERIAAVVAVPKVKDPSGLGSH